MFPSNVPDDWHLYYSNCPDCGKLYHQSENYCSCNPEDESLDEEYEPDSKLINSLQADFVDFIQLLVCNSL
jgi:hypothetical protein